LTALIAPCTNGSATGRQAESTLHGERLILASASPQRQVLLRELCPDFDVIPSPRAEPVCRSTRVAPAAWAQALAYFKARAVAEEHPGRWVLGADTLVACAGRMLGKPADVRAAREMLELQARHVSEVITGVCLVRSGRGFRRIAAADTTRVWMRDDAALREAYLASGDWAGKAGAYGIQTVGDRMVARIEGSFSNVVGLPLERLARIITAIVPTTGCAD
jgi:septum formation protein